MTSRASLVVAVHDGFYGAGTGAGYANRGFLATLIDALAPDVRLVVAPILLNEDSPEYQTDWHKRMEALCARVGADIAPVDNGTAGQVRFGGVDAFACAAESLADSIARYVRPTAAPFALVAFDVPFLGVSARLAAAERARTALVPRSTGLLHDPDNQARVSFERAGFRALAAAGGRIAPISAYMRRHLLVDYEVPERALLDLPDGLTADEWDFQPPCPPDLPAAAAAGFLLAYGRAAPYKGWDDLIEALAILRDRGVVAPHALLAAVTDQPMATDYQRHLAERLREHALDATLLTRFDPSIRGLLSHPALRGVIVASRSEPFGRVPLEAYAGGGAPVVATTAGGLAEQVIDGVTGFTATAGDPGSLASAIARAVAVGESGRARLRAHGLELARSRYDHRDAVRTFFATFAPWALTTPPPAAVAKKRNQA